MNCDKVFPAVVGLDQESDMPLSELRLLCARKALLGIRERLVVDRSIVEGGFIQVLNSERISVPREIPIDYPDELLPDLSPSYYAIPPTLHSFFKSSKVPRSSLNEPYFELTSASLPAWRDVITHLLGCLATSLGIPHDSQTPAGTDISCLSESNLRLILAMLDAIRSLVATRGFQAFLRTDNVNATLGLAIMTKDIEMNRRNEMKMRTYLPNFSSTRRHCSANPSRWNLLDLADLRQETIETYYNLFTRWLLGLTAWVDAFDIVTRHPLLRAQNKPIRVHRLCTKTSETRMTPIQAIVDSAMDGFSSVQIVKTSISKYLQCIVSADAWNDGMGFSGSLHSEAASIALNIGLRNGSVQLEEENIVDVRVRVSLSWNSPSFHNFSCDRQKTYCSVGLSHKSCWCCARLALLGREHGLKFEIKGTHQVVYPWDPPKFGISHADLQTIEAGLKKKLVNSLQFLATSPTPVSPK
jgi:hypothetical protein